MAEEQLDARRWWSRLSPAARAAVASCRGQVPADVLQEVRDAGGRVERVRGSHGRPVDQLCEPFLHAALQARAQQRWRAAVNGLRQASQAGGPGSAALDRAWHELETAQREYEATWDCEFVEPEPYWPR